MLVYKIRTDAAYYRTIIARYYGRRPFLVRFPLQYAIASLAAAGYLIWKMGSLTQAAVGVAVIVGLLLAAAMVWLTKLGTFYRFKRRADFGAEAVLTVSENGITSSGHHANGRWAWQAYPRSVRYPDGILLMRRGVIRWLPDAALRDGTPSDATALVKSKTILSDLTRNGG